MKRRHAERLIFALGGSMLAVGLAWVVILAVGIAAKVFEPIQPYEQGYTIDAMPKKMFMRSDSKRDAVAVGEGVHPVQRY